MTSKASKRSKKSGLPPGSPVYVGKQKEHPIEISVIDYGPDSIEERSFTKIEECFAYKGKPTVTWINVNGVHQPEVLAKLSECFELHPLVKEDIVNTEQRPKVEDYGQYLYLVLRMLSQSADHKSLVSEQVSLVIGSNYVISFQEEGKKGDVFDQVRERIRAGKSRIRSEGADYLAYSLIDAVVDNYFLIMEGYGESVEDLEDALLVNPTPKILNAIHTLKREVINLRKSIWPLREVASFLERGESPMIKPSVRVYFRDIYDHTVQIIESIETYREMMSSIVDIYLSSMSNKLNEIMKVLTIISTIFIPLTFIVGLYGMNFKYMPELNMRLAYPILWVVMLCIAGGMLVYFRKKKWI